MVWWSRQLGLSTWLGKRLRTDTWLGWGLVNTLWLGKGTCETAGWVKFQFVVGQKYPSQRDLAGMTSFTANAQDTGRLNGILTHHLRNIRATLDALQYDMTTSLQVLFSVIGIIRLTRPIACLVYYYVAS